MAYLNKTKQKQKIIVFVGLQCHLLKVFQMRINPLMPIMWHCPWPCYFSIQQVGNFSLMRTIVLWDKESKKKNVVWVLWSEVIILSWLNRTLKICLYYWKELSELGELNGLVQDFVPASCYTARKWLHHYDTLTTPFFGNL